MHICHVLKTLLTTEQLANEYKEFHDLLNDNINLYLSRLNVYFLIFYFYFSVTYKILHMFCR